MDDGILLAELFLLEDMIRRTTENNFRGIEISGQHVSCRILLTQVQVPGRQPRRVVRFHRVQVVEVDLIEPPLLGVADQVAEAVAPQDLVRKVGGSGLGPENNL